jgi:acetylornithine deacetylase/succinyl-diaminopimelate desuccinylase-like protein
VVAAARHAAEAEKVGFRMEKKMGIDYSKASPKDDRLNHPLVQTAVATGNYFRKPGTPAIKAQDAGSTDANIAVSMGIPAVAVGAVLENMPHRLEENAEASSMIPGIKSLIALAVATTTH